MYYVYSVENIYWTSRDRQTVQCLTSDIELSDGRSWRGEHSIMLNVTWRRFDQSAKQLVVGHATKITVECSGPLQDTSCRLSTCCTTNHSSKSKAYNKYEEIEVMEFEHKSTIHRMKWRYRISGHDTIAILELRGEDLSCYSDVNWITLV